VIGMQWYWQIQHPGGQQELDELHVPLGQPVRLNMISLDVVHSFWVPAFRIKQDVLPGRYTTTWFQATKPGRYHLFCAQYCGTQHANMVGWVDVMSPSDYQHWLSGNHSDPSLATAGARLFVQYSCTGCHAHSATVRAPSLNGLYGKPVPLSDGTVTVADDRYLHDSIVQPGIQVVAGYQNVMPSYKGALNEGQLLALVAYIRSLGQEPEQENIMQSQNALTRARVREMQERAQREQLQMKRRLTPAAEYPGRIDALKPQPSSGLPDQPGSTSHRSPDAGSVPVSSGANLRANTPAARNPSGAEPESGGPPATNGQSPATNYQSGMEPQSGGANR
jgi:cytochrome c551/c552